ncbi:MAG: hypothetical protein SGBAC_013125 [Bacillariaceae sp.]
MISLSLRLLFCSICLLSLGLKANAFTTCVPAESQLIQRGTNQHRCVLPTTHPTSQNARRTRRSICRLLCAATSSAALTDLLDTLDDKRNIPSLQDWAVEQGVQFAEGVLLVDNGMGDWGVGLSANHSHLANTPIMTIPAHLILSSNDDRIAPATEAFVGNKMAESSPGMDYYAKECLLMMVLLLEQLNGEGSNWSPWLESLPRSYPTGISFDPLERSHVERMAPAFLEQQDKQWNACWHAVQQVLVVDDDDGDSVKLPTGFRDVLLKYNKSHRGNDNTEASINLEEINEMDDERTLKELVQWAFGAVFTRSWRSPDGRAATLVPLGDMFNHDSVMANVYPSLLLQEEEEKDDDDYDDDDEAKTTKGSSIQMKLKTNVEGGSPLYLSYGMGNQPARFLVNFGFWDRSASLMDANLTVPEAHADDWPVDLSELVVSTRSGGISEEVWNLAIYRFLLDQQERQDQDEQQQQQQQQNDDDSNDTFCNAAAKLAQARKHSNSTTFQTMLDQYDIPAIMYLRRHALQIVSQTYPEMDLCPEGKPSESPRRFGMIARYNNGMRESWLSVAEALELELEDALAKRRKEG